MFKPNRWFGWSRSSGSPGESTVISSNSNTHSLEQLKQVDSNLI